MKKVLCILVTLLAFCRTDYLVKGAYKIPQQTLEIKTQDNINSKIVGSIPIMTTPEGSFYRIQSGNYIQLGSFDSSYNLAQGFTIKLKIKWIDFASYSRVFDFYTNSAGKDNFLLTHTGTGKNMLVGARKGSSTTDISLGMDFQQNIIEEYVIQADAACNITTVNKTTGKSAAVKHTTCPFINNVTRNINYIGKSAWTSDKYFNGEIYYLEIRSSDNRLLLKMDAGRKQ